MAKSKRDGVKVAASPKRKASEADLAAPVAAAALWNRAPNARATLLLAHGAGAPMDSPFMNAIAAGLVAHGITVVRFEFPYMAARRLTKKQTPPNRMPVLEASYRAQFEGVARDRAVQPAELFIGGKSMGGRVATMIADSLSVAGVVALGYPFHPPKQTEKLRVAHLTELQTRCLIVQGTRDALGSRAEVDGYALSSTIALHWLEDGDHSFAPRKASGRSEAQNLNEAVSAIAAFMLGSAARPASPAQSSGAVPDSVRRARERAPRRTR